MDDSERNNSQLDKFYKVATSVGLAKNAFSGGDLAAYSGTVHVNKDKLVSIRQDAL